MSLTALIIDDEQLAREELEFLLENDGEVEVLAQGSNGIEAVDLVRRHHPDLLFLDVQMPGLDGFGVLRKLLEAGGAMPQVIFATAFDQYAVRAFDVNAIDYLLKPFDKARVLQALDRARQRLQPRPSNPPAGAPLPTSGTGTQMEALLRLVEQNTTALGATAHGAAAGKLVLQSGSRLLLVDQRDVCFAAVENGSVTVTTNTLEGQSRCRTLEELLELLSPTMFWRAHRSYVVNLHHIREVVPWFKGSYQLRMDDKRNSEVPVSRTQTRRLRELFKL